MKRLMKLLAGLGLVAIGAGCSTIKYGDGNVGTVSLNPAIATMADAADARVPGSGAKIRAWYSQAAVSRVPDGYVIAWDSFLDGRQIDPTKIITVPRLAPAAQASVVVVGSTAVTTTVPDPTPDAPDADIEDALNNL